MKMDSKGPKQEEDQKLTRILHLEDSAMDAEIVENILQRSGLTCKIRLVPDRESYEQAVSAEPYDLILCDHGVPSYRGMDAIQFARERQPRTPVIVLSGTIDDSSGVESLKNGATDYVLKHRLSSLAPAVRRALKEAEGRQAREQAEESIRSHAQLLDLTQDAIVVRGLDEEIQFWNRGAERLFHMTRAEAIGKKFTAIIALHEEAFQKAAADFQAGGEWSGELQFRDASGMERTILSRWNAVFDNHHRPKAILSVNTDVTEKKELESRLLRSQRMESIGALAGGIAHDLNNALAPVMMCAEMLRGSDDALQRDKYVDLIIGSSQRATGMVKQILAFGRGTNNRNRLLCPTLLLREIVKMTEETFPKTIRIRLDTVPETLCKVKGDETELHQVLLNLCVNARDAMPSGGELTLSLAEVELDSSRAAELHGPPGRYGMFSVKDTGTGIPPEVLPRIFEAFFTTKLPDKGTGLGLASVSDIVRHHGGLIDVATKLYLGSEFKIYLPAVIEKEINESEATKSVPHAGHQELILVIDDEASVRELLVTSLEGWNYRIVAAENGAVGLAKFKEHAADIRLVISDMDMPQMGGMSAVEAMRKINPKLGIIFASGNRPETVHLRRFSGAVRNLGKPFSLHELLKAVSSILSVTAAD